jgi:pimeloyl-ACP methyl ester carboxylesterase
MGNRFSGVVVNLLVFLGGASGQENGPPSPGVSPGPGLSAVTAKSVEVASKQPWRYLLYLPQRYVEHPEEKLPLLLFLHGSSGRGQDLERLKRYGPPARLKDEVDFPMAMVAPQLPAGAWETSSVLELLDEVVASFRMDPDRIYLTGVSLGGQGAWGIAARAPERFAAMAPVCGFGDLQSAARLRNLPIWAFHGALDEIVPLAPHQQLVEAVNRAGGSARLTIYEQGDHGDILVPVYGRKTGSRLYTWLLRQRRNQPSPAWTEEERLERLPGPGAPPPVALPQSPASAPVSSSEPGEFWDLLFRWIDGLNAPASLPPSLPPSPMPDGTQTEGASVP